MGNWKNFKYFDSEVDLGLEFGAGVSGYFFVLRAFACLFFAAFALNLPVMFVNYTSTYYASHYEAEPETATAPTADALSGRPTTVVSLVVRRLALGESDERELGDRGARRRAATSVGARGDDEWGAAVELE